jgi:hypothetical protein
VTSASNPETRASGAAGAGDEGEGALSSAASNEGDASPSPAQATVRNAIAARHSSHLEELIDRGKGLALEMFEDASNRELEELRRIQFVRLADRLSDTIRKLIVSYDRHRKELG